MGFLDKKYMGMMLKRASQMVFPSDGLSIEKLPFTSMNDESGKLSSYILQAKVDEENLLALAFYENLRLRSLDPIFVYMSAVKTNSGWHWFETDLCFTMIGIHETEQIIDIAGAILLKARYDARRELETTPIGSTSYTTPIKFVELAVNKAHAALGLDTSF